MMKPKVISETVTIERLGSRYRVTFPDGRSLWARTQQQALDEVRADAASREGSFIILTTVEWSGVSRLIAE